VCLEIRTQILIFWIPRTAKTKEFLSMKNRLQTPTPIGQSRRALMAERDALKLENRLLQHTSLPDYIELWTENSKQLGLTNEQIIGCALLHLEYDETVDAPMPPDMCEAFVEYVEGRALASVAPAPNASTANVIAFRKRKTLG
jgi:hypothetical protein